MEIDLIEKKFKYKYCGIQISYCNEHQIMFLVFLLVIKFKINFCLQSIFDRSVISRHPQKTNCWAHPRRSVMLVTSLSCSKSFKVSFFSLSYLWLLGWVNTPTFYPIYALSNEIGPWLTWRRGETPTIRKRKPRTNFALIQ